MPMKVTSMFMHLMGSLCSWDKMKQNKSTDFSSKYAHVNKNSS